MFAPTCCLSFITELEDGDETSGSCPDFDIKMIKKCQVVGPPVSYDLPVHSFFLTGSKAISSDDVTMYTALTVDRLVRLKEMAVAWKGPISAAIAIKSLSEIPMILKMWSESKDFRMYADIHLVYDDQVRHHI